MIKLRDLLCEFYINGFIGSDEKSKFKQPENFDKYAEDKWQAYTGGDDWESGRTRAAVYFNEHMHEKCRVWLEIKYPSHLEKMVGEGISNTRPEYKKIQEWGNKATKRWITEARRIRFYSRHKLVPESYRWSYKDWKECFVEALRSPRMKPYVKNWGVDKTDWKAMKPYKEEYGDGKINGI
jgi:hypothetical protein